MQYYYACVKVVLTYTTHPLLKVALFSVHTDIVEIPGILAGLTYLQLLHCSWIWSQIVMCTWPSFLNYIHAYLMTRNVMIWASYQNSGHQAGNYTVMVVQQWLANKRNKNYYYWLVGYLESSQALAWPCTKALKYDFGCLGN